MNRFNLFLSMLLLLLVGCASGVVLHDQLLSSASAQSFSEPVNQFKECAVVRDVWTIRAKHINKGELPEKTVKVPAGWSVVGAGTGGQYIDHTMLICR